MLRLSVIYVRTFYLTFHCLPPRTISWFFIVSQQIICSTNASLNSTFILLIIMECLHFDIWKWYIWFIWYIGWIVWCFSCVHSQLLLKGVFAEHHPGSDVPLYAFMCSSHLKNAMSGRQFYPNLLCYVNSLKFKSSTCWSQQWIFFQWAENNPLLSNHCLPSWVSSLTYQLFWNEWRFIQFSMQQYMLLLHCHFAHSMMVVFLLWSTTISEL